MLQAYELEVRLREGPGIRQELDRLFETLREENRNAPVVPKKILKAAKVKVRGAAKQPINRDRGAAITKARGAAKQPTNKGRGAANTKARGTADTTAKKATLTKQGTIIKVPKKVGVKKIKTKGKVLKPAREANTARPSNKRKTKTSRSERHVMTNLQFDRQLPKSIKWSPWHLAMSIVDGPAGDRIQQTCKVFQKSQNQPVVYEVSVQTEKKKKYRVMYCCHSAGVRGELINRLLKLKRVQKEIQNVLDQNCKVFIRRFVMKTSVTIDGQEKKTARELKNTILKKFDYVWNRSEKKISHVRISGKVISTGMAI